MSKGSDGPSAQSFENPRKVGWLHKHGGSGMSSHWKKRWFIVDHHYLFYFKGPNDKKPVGILCLPEYQSCHKADNKESKKPNSFVLDRSTSDSEAGDGPSKNYILHTDSEGDMENWMAAIREEMKAILGGDASFSSSSSSNTPKPKIDQKAFDEVAVIVSEGPKLSHPTASRPKPRGRRPPKKYAVFHEDDTKDDDSPNLTPSPSSSSLSAKPLPSSPSSSPASSPRISKKGNQPATPILPKAPMTPPNKPKSATLERVENGSSSSKPSTKPEPPKKVPRQDSVPSPDADSPRAAPKPPARPTLPRKPTPAVPTESPVHTEVSAEQFSETKPSVNVRPKPTPPRAKPRRLTSASSGTELSEAPSNEVAQPPPPQPKPRRSMSPEPEAVPTPLAKKPRPVPASRKPEGPKGAIIVVPNEKGKPLQDIEPVDDGGEVAEMKEKEDEGEVAEVNEKEAQMHSAVDESLTASNDMSLEEVIVEVKQESKDDKEEDEIADEELGNGDVDENGAMDADMPLRPTTYENVELSNEKEGKETEQKKNNDARVNYEDMSYESKKETSKHGNGTEENQNQSNYVEMAHGVHGTDSTQDKSDVYEPVEVVENDDDSKNDYEIPQDWSEQNIASTRSSGGFVPMGLTPDLRDEETAIYDVPPSPRPAYDDRPSSTATGDSVATSQSQEAESRSNSVTSTGSLSSKNSSEVSSNRPSTVSFETSVQSAGAMIIVADPMPNLDQRIECLEDSIEKAAAPQSNGTDNSSDSSNFYDKREAETVAKALLQAKEILRLAKAAKAEADQIKKESTRELELARRERHDASLLKKNAAEILRIAKMKLGK